MGPAPNWMVPVTVVFNMSPQADPESRHAKTSTPIHRALVAALQAARKRFIRLPSFFLKYRKKYCFSTFGWLSISLRLAQIDLVSVLTLYPICTGTPSGTPATPSRNVQLSREPIAMALPNLGYRTASLAIHQAPR